MPQRVPPEPLPPPPAPDLRPTIAYWRSPPGKRWATRLVFGGGIGGFAVVLLLVEAPWWLTVGTAATAAFLVVQAERERLLVGENWISEGGRRYVRLDQLSKVTTSIGNAATRLHLTDRNRRHVSFYLDEIAREAPTILRVVTRAIAEAAARGDLQLSPGVESLVRQHYRPRKRTRRGTAAAPGPARQGGTGSMPGSGGPWGEVVPGAVVVRVRLDGAEVRGYGVGPAVDDVTARGGRWGQLTSRARGWWSRR